MIEAIVNGVTVRLVVDAPYGIPGREMTVRCEINDVHGQTADANLAEFRATLEVERLEILQPAGPRAWRVRAPAQGLGTLRLHVSHGSETSVLEEKVPILSNEPPNRLGDAEWGGPLEIRNAWIRWIVVQEGYGYPMGFLYVKEDDGWHRRASSSLVGRVVVGSPSHPRAVPLIPTKWVEGPDEGQIQLLAEASIPEVGWSNPPPASVRLTIRYGINGSKPYLGVDYEAETDTVINLALLDGPSLIVDGTTLIREEGLFPGLEWLRPGEVSSSTLDVHGQEHFRMSPHPLKLTWPLMAFRMDQLVVGLLWDNQATWNGEDSSYAAQYSSPDVWYGTDPHHRMGLALPGGARYRSHENQLLADVYRWPAHTPLRCSAVITAKTDQPSILSVLDDWIACYGLPSASLPPFDYGTEWQMAREAYASTFWNEERHGWGHVLGWPPQYFPVNAFLAKMLAGGRRDASVRQLEQILEEGERLLTPETLLDHCHIPGWEPAFLFEEGSRTLAEAAKRAHGLLTSQASDGNWGFSPQTQTQSSLGTPGTKAVGITAVHAETLLTIGQLLRDYQLIAGGVRALVGMQRFQVPRAAQVWECPVHTPDILAAARAVNAYVAGYHATGNAEYLGYARYWAKTGLPFLYVWEAPGRTVMRWASIAIFGSTFYTMSWFGRPVQWNGMVFADALLRLAPYDQSWPWIEIARGILHSAMHQQRLTHPGRGGYPDSWYLPDNQPVQGVDINPETMVKVLLRLEGLPVHVTTMRLKTADHPHLSTVGGMVLEDERTDQAVLLISGWQQSHRRLLVVAPKAVAGAEYFAESRWNAAKAIRHGDKDQYWIDWGEPIPPMMKVRLVWK